MTRVMSSDRVEEDLEKEAHLRGDRRTSAASARQAWLVWRNPRGHAARSDPNLKHSV